MASLAARAAARHRAPQQPAQHVPGALVAGQSALGDREHQTTHVVGDDPRVAQRHLGIGRAPGAALEHRLHDRLEDVGLEDDALALHDHREALDAHPGVDTGAWKRLERSIGMSVELWEHQVPELHETVAGISRALAPEGAGRQIVGTLLAEVEVDLAAGTARAGAARRTPEVVLAPERHDSALGHADLLP